MSRCIAFLISLGLLIPLCALAQVGSKEGVSSNTSSLLTRHQQRMDILEQGLKDIRGVLEKDLRELRIKLEQVGSSSVKAGSDQDADLMIIRREMEKLGDMLAVTNRRMERTLEITSDTEFRLLRLEKRFQTMISLVGADAASAIVQSDVTGVQTPAKVEMSRESSDAVVKWSVGESALNRELKVIEEESADNKKLKSADEIKVGDPSNKSSSSEAVSKVALNSDVSEETRDNTVLNSNEKPMAPEVLPAVNPEEQYRYALGRALQNDFEIAERAFVEFREYNVGHEREADATYWLGRVQFMRGEYEKAALTFTEFNSAYPEDARLMDTTIWIAESVSHFAPAEQACEIYKDLPQLVDSPPESFLTKLAELIDAAQCKS